MRDISLLNSEITLAQRTYGPDRVFWADNCDWIKIDEVPLPPTMNKRKTRILVIVPENYGHGEGYKDCFVDNSLRVMDPSRAAWVEIPHYFDKRGTINRYYFDGWRYMCIHQKDWTKGKDNIITYLTQIYTFLSDPFRDWNGKEAA